MEVPPSPELHERELMVPVDASVKVTLSGAVPVVGDALKPATGAVGAGETTMRLVFVSVSEPPGPVTVRDTVKVPAAKEWDGLVTVDVPPSPKFHERAVMLPVEESVKVTFRGAVPVVGDALKPATGAVGAGETTMRFVFVSESEPPGPVTVRVTV